MKDIPEQEIDFWTSKITFEEVKQFTLQHKVEVLMQNDCQYHCYVNYKQDGQSYVYAVGLTSLGALFEGVYKYIEQHKELQT